MSIYATKSDLKNATGVDTSNFAEKTDLNSLKSKVDKLDISNLVTFTADLSKLKDVVKYDFVS